MDNATTHCKPRLLSTLATKPIVKMAILSTSSQEYKQSYGSEDGGLSFKPYKNVVVVKSLNNFTNVKPNNPHGFKEDLKIKYDAALAVVGKFPNGTGPMMALLQAEITPLTWADYC